MRQKKGLLIIFAIILGIGILFYILYKKCYNSEQKKEGFITAVSKYSDVMDSIYPSYTNVPYTAEFTNITAPVYVNQIGDYIGAFAVHDGGVYTDFYNACRYIGMPGTYDLTLKKFNPLTGIRIKIVTAQIWSLVPAPSKTIKTSNGPDYTITPKSIPVNKPNGYLIMLPEQIYTVRVTGNNNSGSLWGTDPFLDISSLGKAAVYAGKIKVGEIGNVTIRFVKGLTTYVGGSVIQKNTSNVNVTVTSATNSAPPAGSMAFTFNITAPTTTTQAITTTTSTKSISTVPPVHPSYMTYDLKYIQYVDLNDLIPHFTTGFELYFIDSNTSFITNSVNNWQIDSKYISYDYTYQRYNLLFSPENKFLLHTTFNLNIDNYESIIFWIRPNTITNIICPIIGTNKMNYLLYQENNALILIVYAIVFNNTTGKQEQYEYVERWNNIFELYTWAHIIFTSNNGTFNIYKNGKYVPKQFNTIMNINTFRYMIDNLKQSDEITYFGSGINIYNNSNLFTKPTYMPYFSGNIMEISNYNNYIFNESEAVLFYNLPIPKTYAEYGVAINLNTPLQFNILPAPTTTAPTTSMPTTTIPTTTTPTTTAPTTTMPTTTMPTTTAPTTSMPTTTMPTTTMPTTSMPTTTMPTTTAPTTTAPTTTAPTTTAPTTTMPTTYYEPTTTTPITYYEPATTTSTYYEPAAITSSYYESAATTSTYYEPATPTSTYYEPATTTYYEPATTTYYEPAATTSTYYEPATTTSTYYEPTTTSTYYEPTTTSSYYEPTATTSTYYEPATTTPTYYEPATTTSTYYEPTTTSTYYEPTTTSTAVLITSAQLASDNPVNTISTTKPTVYRTPINPQTNTSTTTFYIDTPTSIYSESPATTTTSTYYESPATTTTSTYSESPATTLYTNYLLNYSQPNVYADSLFDSTRIKQDSQLTTYYSTAPQTTIALSIGSQVGNN